MITERRDMTKHIVCIFGASGSGKDTMAKWLLERNFLERKYARPMKAFVEQCYNLKPGTLDTQEGKAQLIPGGSSKTFADLLVGAYHFWTQFDDAMTARNVTRDIVELFTESPWNVVLTDMRKAVEAVLLRDYFDELGIGDEDDHYRLHLVVIGGRGVELSSDRDQRECVDILKNYAWSWTYIDNSKDVDFFKKQVDNFVETKLH